MFNMPVIGDRVLRAGTKIPTVAPSGEPGIPRAKTGTKGDKCNVTSQPLEALGAVVVLEVLGAVIVFQTST